MSASLRVARTDRSGSTRQGSELALERHGSALALVDADRELSYLELARRCDEVTERLGPTRRLVAVRMSNTVSAVVAYLGARRGGHAVVLVQPDRSAACVDRWNPDVELSGAGDAVELVEHRVGTAHELHPDLGLLMSTSGSTGSPKCVRLSGTNLSSNAVAIGEYLGLEPDDRAITSLPLHYCYGLSVLHSHLAVGAGVVVSERSVVDRCFWSSVSEHAVTSIAAVPHSLDLMDRSGTTSGLGTASLRRLTVAGGRTAPAVVERYAALGERWGWDLVVMYGQTEATARMAYLPPELARCHPGSIGVAIPGGALELVPHDGADPDVGELEYRGPNVMMGYATTPSDLCRGHEVAALRTGDLARRSEDGLFEIVGRSNRFAKLFGLRIDLDHLEDVLSGHGVSAWCVATDSELALLTTDVRAARTAELVAAETGVPRSAVHVAVAEELPRHPNGKPDRRGVGAAVRSPVSLDHHGESPSPVRTLLGHSLGVQGVRGEETFVSLGGDSLSYVEVSLRLEELLGHLPPDWHTTPVDELERRLETDAGSDRRPPRWRRLETNLVLRASAIVLVVCSHAGVFRLRGGAHVLLAVAGFNFARFVLRPGAPTLRSTTARTIARVALPAVVWLAGLSLLTGEYGWASVGLVNSYLGVPEWSAAWRYWFIEALVMVLILATMIMSVPAVRRWDIRHRTAVPLLLLAVALAARFDVVSLGSTPEPLLAPHRVGWFFVLGWLVARAERTGTRLIATGVILLAVPGFFGEASRDLVVVVGLCALTWLPTLPVPRRLAGPLGLLAGASLYIYLSHYQVYLPLLDHGVPPLLGALAAISVGIVLWRWCDPVLGRLVDATRPRNPTAAEPVAPSPKR